MERRAPNTDLGPFAPSRWPSIARASAELRRPRHLQVVRDAPGAVSPAAARDRLERTREGAERR